VAELSAPPGPGAVLDVARAARPLGASGSGGVHELWATCAPGVEPEAAAELGALGWEVDGPLADGAVVGTAAPEVLAATHTWARTIHGVHLRLADIDVADLEVARHDGPSPPLTDVLGHALTDVELPLWPATATVAVRADRDGDHRCTSVELAAAAAEVLLDGYVRATGRRPPIDLDDPDIEVVVRLRGRRLLVGVALHHDDLRQRAWRRASHRAGLDATVAAALLARAGWRPGEVLLDPCCGAGTILVEAALAGAGRAPDGTDRHLEGAAGGDGTSLRLYGRDRRGAALRSAATNLDAVGLGGVADLRRGDLRRTLDVPEVDVVLANPPFGIRVGHPGDVAELTRRGLARIAERLTDGGRVLWLCPHDRTVREAAEDVGLEVVRADPLRLGDLEVVAVLLVPGSAGPRGASSTRRPAARSG
jgi:tRNA (guanine6-N2)-methyltransferase